MITKFGSLYAGNVDLDNIGLEGTPVNDRSLSDEHLATVFEKSKNFAQTMDRLGYSTFWGAEHHYQKEGYECIPNLLMLFVHLAQVTENLKFGCGFNITPMWHPLRLAEDWATADILTGGRIIFGVGRGYHSREGETFAISLGLIIGGKKPVCLIQNTGMMESGDSIRGMALDSGFPLVLVHHLLLLLLLQRL